MFDAPRGGRPIGVSDDLAGRAPGSPLNTACFDAAVLERRSSSFARATTCRREAAVELGEGLSTAGVRHEERGDVM
jgi:hypothetical protein